MACFLVSAAEATIVTVASKIIEKKEQTPEVINVSFDGVNLESTHKIPFSRKLKWLSNLQWGGSILLAFEHVWHGEIVPYFPFLSAMKNPGDATEMFIEMATVGVGMAVLTTAVWVGMLGIAALIEKRAIKESSSISIASIAK